MNKPTEVYNLSRSKAVANGLIRDIEFVEVETLAEQAPSLHQEEEDEQPFDAETFLVTHPGEFEKCLRLQKNWENKQKTKEEDQPFDSGAFLAKNGYASKSLEECMKLQKSSDKRQKKLQKEVKSTLMSKKVKRIED